ncbi:MAG: hypothetical protein ACKO3S_01640 [bacterium]
MSRPSRRTRPLALAALVAVLFASARPVPVPAQDVPVRDVLDGPTGGRRFT